MTRPIYKTITLLKCPDTDTTPDPDVNYDYDYFASNVSGDTWTLTNSEITNGMAHQVSIKNDTATDHSGKTAEIIGYYDKYPITETINLPGSSAVVKTTKYFTKIISITPSASIGVDTMDIGICEQSIIAPFIICNWRGYAQGIYTTISNATAIKYTIQKTASEVEPSWKKEDYDNNVFENVYDNLNWFDFPDTDVVGATDSTQTNDQEVGRALRWLINTYTADTDPTIDIEITQLDND